MGLLKRLLYAGAGYELLGPWGAALGLVLENSGNNQPQTRTGIALNNDLYQGDEFVPMDPILQRNLKLAVIAVTLYVGKVEGHSQTIGGTIDFSACEEYTNDYEFKQDADELIRISNSGTMEFSYVACCYLDRLPDDQMDYLNGYVKSIVEAGGTISSQGRDFWNTEWWEYMNNRGIFNEYLTK